MESLAFIRKSLTVEPDLRLTVEEALDHPWINKEESLPIKANPQDVGFDFDDATFDIFLKEIFAILIENFDVELLVSLKQLTESKNMEIAGQIIVNDILNIVENTETYDDEIRKLLRQGLKQLNNHVDCSEFLEAVIEEKRHLEQPKFDTDFIFSASEDTNTTNTEDSTSLDSTGAPKQNQFHQA